VLNITTNQVKDIYGRTLGTFDTNYIREFSGMIKYKIDGFLTRSELMTILALIYVI
jgi:hypothetical protein